MTLAMASACVNNIGVTPDQSYLDCPPKSFPAYGWLAPPPRISFSRDYADNTDSKFSSSKKISDATTGGDFEFRLDDPVAMLPAADELFSDGKLVPLDVSAVTVAGVTSAATETGEDKDSGVESNGEERKPPAACSSNRLNNEAVVLASTTNESDPYLFSPKAPRCSSRWRELLGLKRSGGGSAKDTAKSTSSSNLSNNTVGAAAAASSSSSSSSTNIGSKSIRYFLQRNSKSSNSNHSSTSDTSLNLPLLRDTDSEPLSVSSRLSLSSISSSSSSSSVSHDYVDDLPRLSLDSLTATKNRSNTIHRHHHTSLYRSSSGPNNYPRVKMVKPRMVQTPSPSPTTTLDNTQMMPPLIDHPSAPTTTTIPVTNRVGRSPIRLSGGEHDSSMMMRGLSVDSPRLSSSGKIVFQGLERSSSSPSTFNGGPRYKHSRPIDRSYSANVRVVIAPVLNVPVGSFRGSSKSSGGGGGGMFGFFSSSSSTSAQSSQLKKETGGGSGSSGGSGGVKGQHHHHHHYHQLVRR